jgi:hypothetical protein
VAARLGLAQTKQQIQQMNQQLGVLNNFAAANERAVTTLMSLHAAGINDHEIAELCKLVDMWNQNQQSPGMTQGNGSGGATTNNSKMLKWDTEILRKNNEKLSSKQKNN